MAHFEKLLFCSGGNLYGAATKNRDLKQARVYNIIFLKKAISNKGGKLMWYEPKEFQKYIMWFLLIYINFSIAQYSSQSHHQRQNHYKSPHLYHLLYQTLAKKTAILRHCKSQKSLKNYKKIFLLFQGIWLWRRTLNKYLSL